ncbi:MAG TPA: prepilin-type N-terminal cleavage/methylation domain-containing protein [Bryobacteraceae bacterium]|jgi:general secretion pathway protein J
MKENGVTLLEVLIAVTLLSLLSVAMFLAMRIGLNSYERAGTRLMDNRRVAGAQRILQDEIEGLVPVIATCGAVAGGPGQKALFFEGQPEVMRLVSTFSLNQGWRGQPKILEILVIPGENGLGVRLVANETLYTGPQGAGRFCTGPRQFLPADAGPKSFVLADKLAYCHFAYLSPAPAPLQPPIWRDIWITETWPLAVRIDMAPLEPNPAAVQPVSIIAPLNLHRNPAITYEDVQY